MEISTSQAETIHFQIDGTRSLQSYDWLNKPWIGGSDWLNILMASYDWLEEYFLARIWLGKGDIGLKDRTPGFQKN